MGLILSSKQAPLRLNCTCVVPNKDFVELYPRPRGGICIKAVTETDDVTILIDKRQTAELIQYLTLTLENQRGA